MGAPAPSQAERKKVSVDPAFARLAAARGTMPPAHSASQRAYDLILHGIMTGVLPSGKRLPEVPLAQGLGLGRTPVREALMRLEADGFVASEPRVGMVVASNTVRSMAEIYEIMEVLEGFSARLAARHAGSSDFAAARSVLQEAEAPTRTQDVDLLRTLNTRFHRLIHVSTRNDQLVRELDRLLNLVRLSPSSAYAVPGRPEQAMAEHIAILDAIMNRDEDLAEKLAFEHKRRDKEARLAQMVAGPFD